MENREPYRLSPQTFERMCQHLEPMVDIPPNHSLRPELEDFVLEQENAFSRQFESSQLDNSKAGTVKNMYEMRFAAYLRENLHQFRNHLAKKQREVQFAENQWQRFCSLDSTEKLNWLEKIKSSANSTNGKQIGNFYPKDILQQIEIMRYNVENGILKPDFMQFPPRDFKCFNFCLNKLTQGILNQAQNSQQAKPKPDEPPRIYNNTNIMINNNYLPPPGAQRPMGFPNPMLASPSMGGIPYAAKQPPLKKSMDPSPNPASLKPAAMPMGIAGTTPNPASVKPKPMSEPYDDTFWERMLNLAENPSLNDAIIASSIKQKKPEKKKSEYQLTALEPPLQKKVKKDEVMMPEAKKPGQVAGQTVVVINRTSTPNTFMEGFKDCLMRFEEVFRKNIITTVEKLRENGIAFTVKKALVENGLCFKRKIIELKLEYGALKVLIYPNNIAIIDCKSLKELEICFDNLKEIQDLLKVVNKWQEFTDFNVKSQKH